MGVEHVHDSVDRIGRGLLACPKCHQPLPDVSRSERCGGCGHETEVADGVVIARERDASSYFDATYEVMQDGNRMPGTWDIFYAEQVRHIEGLLKEGEVVVDVGCGPTLQYDPRGALTIGVDASLPSIRANRAVSLRVFASASELPVRSNVVDTIVCFYSVHHMTGVSRQQNAAIVEKVFGEFARVLKADGRLLVFDMSPWFPFSAAEDLVWNTAKARLGSGLDMYFWKDRHLEEIASRALGECDFNVRRFGRAPLQMFPPVFSKPGLRIPRALYPFDVNLYTWGRKGR